MATKKKDVDCDEKCAEKCATLKKEVTLLKKQLAAVKKSSNSAKQSLLQEYFDLSENGWKDRSEKEKVISRKNEIIAKLKS